MLLDGEARVGEQASEEADRFACALVAVIDRVVDVIDEIGLLELADPRELAGAHDLDRLARPCGVVVLGCRGHAAHHTLRKCSRVLSVAGRPKRTSTGFAPLEAEVMKAVWAADGPVSVREVLDVVNRERAELLAYTTVMTVMNRLGAKHVLERRGKPRAYVY